MKPQQVPRPRHLDLLLDDERGYPIISTIGRNKDHTSFGSINEPRKLALATFDWCAVCGLPFAGTPRWQMAPSGTPTWAGDRQGKGVFFNEAPVHEICIVYAAHVCPHLSSPGHRMGDEYRAGQRRTDTIRMAGFARTADVRAFRSGLQQETYVLHFIQADFVDEFTYSRPDELADRYAALLSNEELPELTAAESGLISLFNERSGVGDTVTEAALMTGASFARNIKQVLGMDLFTKSGVYQALALQLLDLKNLAEFRERDEERAYKLMAEWLLQRSDNLPEVLSRWRQAGLRLARSKGMALPGPELAGPGRTVAKNDPCPCGSGRRARRCHPAGLPVVQTQPEGPQS
jgi:hypothetical protein